MYKLKSFYSFVHFCGLTFLTFFIINLIRIRLRDFYEKLVLCYFGVQIYIFIKKLQKLFTNDKKEVNCKNQSAVYLHLATFLSCYLRLSCGQQFFILSDTAYLQ